MIEPEYITEEPHGAAEKAYNEAEECVRRYPGSAVLMTIVAGLAIGLLVRALWQERKPASRAQRLLDQIENRLRHLAETPLRKASDAAADQVHMIGKRLRKGETGLEKALRNVGKRVSGLFS
jgi:ElaB/YqjD/DUF883 family membrane-anchored ribosome-binding protein